MTIENQSSVDRALQVIANLQQELGHARKENRYLRAKDGGKHPYHQNTVGRILRRAYDDGIAIVLLRTNGLPVSRRYAYAIGYSERRYTWALGLLRSARIISPRGYAWLVPDFQTADAKLDREYNRLKGQPNALEMLRVFMPKKMEHTYKGRQW